MIYIMVVTHTRYVFYFYFLLTIKPVVDRSVSCPAGQYWEDSTDTCLSCSLICQHADLRRTREKCIAECPGYTPAPPVTSSATPLQQTGTSGPPSLTDTQSMATIHIIVLASVLFIVIVVIGILLVRCWPNIKPIALCRYGRGENQETELRPLKNQQSVPTSSEAANDEQRQILLHPLPTEETCTSSLDNSDHSNPGQDLSTGTQCDTLGCSESDTMVKEIEVSHQDPHPNYALDETTPKSQVFSVPVVCRQEEQYTLLKMQDEPHAPESRPSNWSNNCHVNEFHDGGAMLRSFIHQEEPDTLPKEEDKQQTPRSRLYDGPSSCFVDVPYDQQPKQSSPSCVQGQSVLLLPGGQTYPISDHMHDKMGVQVQDGSGEYEKSSLHVLNNTQPVTLNPEADNFSTHLLIYGSHRNQAVVSQTENQLGSGNESYPGAFGVHNRNVHPDSQYVSPIVLSQPSVRQSPCLTDVPSSSSMMHHHQVTQSPCLSNLTVPLTSMPTLPPFVEQADSFI